MPSSSSKVVRKPQLSPALEPARGQRRKASLRVLAHPSPFIADGATTEAALCEWAAWFARFHTDPRHLYVPIALRTVDCFVSHRKQQTTAAAPPRLMRCVREVAKFNGARRVEWMLINWVPGLPGAQVQHCVTLDDAMNFLNAPPAPVFF